MNILSSRLNEDLSTNHSDGLEKPLLFFSRTLKAKTGATVSAVFKGLRAKRMKSRVRARVKIYTRLFGHRLSDTWNINFFFSIPRLFCSILWKRNKSSSGTHVHGRALQMYKTAQRESSSLRGRLEKKKRKTPNLFSVPGRCSTRESRRGFVRSFSTVPQRRSTRFSLL